MVQGVAGGVSRPQSANPKNQESHETHEIMGEMGRQAVFFSLVSYYYPPKSRFPDKEFSRGGAEAQRRGRRTLWQSTPPVLYFLCASAPLREKPIWLRPVAALSFSWLPGSGLAAMGSGIHAIHDSSIPFAPYPISPCTPPRH